MQEIKILPGKHVCGKKFDMRIVDAKDDDGDPAAWIVYGICKKCNVVLVSGLFLQVEEPVLGTDFLINNNLKSSKGEDWE